MSPALLLPPLLLEAPIAVASFDLEGRVVDANRALLRGGGYTLEEVRGRPFAEFLDPEAAADALARFEALASGAVEVYHTERRYRARGGEMREVDLTVSLVRDEHGRPAGGLAVLQDITDQRAVEDALRLSEARYRELVDQSPLSIQILSPDGETRHVNKAWERLWGATLADLANYNLRRDPQLVESGLMPTIENAFNGVPGLLPAILYYPDRTLPNVSSHQDPRRWVRAVIYPVRGPAGSVREVVLIHEDVTGQLLADHQRQASESERERLLREAQASQRALEAASRMKDEFLAVLSHELRTPLNAVLGWARILSSRAVGEQTMHAAAVIERNALAQARLIDDLIDLARIITGKTRLALDEVDVGAVASGAVESVRPAAEAKRIALVLDIPEPPPIVHADPQRLQQVFWNLLSNAVKFTEAGGSVSMSVLANGQEVTAQVIDTGIGIPAAILPVVFDRFTQGDSSSTRAHSGLGLGLAIVRHLVELHGGTVQAFSDGPGAGSTFRFSIPRR